MRTTPRRTSRRCARSVASLGVAGFLLALTVIPGEAQASPALPTPTASATPADTRRTPAPAGPRATGPDAAERVQPDWKWAFVALGMAAVAATPAVVLHRRDRPPRPEA